MSGQPSLYTSRSDGGAEKQRAFCPTCGSPLYTLLDSMPDALILKAGSLDDPSLFHPQMVLYTDSGCAWDHTDPALPHYAKMPPSG